VEEHYLLEKQLARRLMTASSEERRKSYSAVYDELFRRLPTHPQNLQKSDPQTSRSYGLLQWERIKNLVVLDSVFAEVGAGDCALSFEAASHVKKVYAIDVSRVIAQGKKTPKNFELIISDGVSIPLPEPVNIVYSNQLMEHLHPDDAAEQLRNIYRALGKGGKYLVITPNRLTGPHDVSGYFDDVATGFHLKEYSLGELVKLLKVVGFSKVEYWKTNGKVSFRTWVTPIIVSENLIGRLPMKLRSWVLSRRLINLMLDEITLIATK